MSLVEPCNVHDFVLSASALSSHNLDLSRKGISGLPAELPGCEKLEVYTIDLYTANSDEKYICMLIPVQWCLSIPLLS